MGEDNEQDLQTTYNTDDICELCEEGGVENVICDKD